MPSRTLVSFHAHPVDEVLLTGGTLARAAAQGHRVVLALATDGEAGSPALGRTRVAELERAAGLLGCARVVRFCLPDGESSCAEDAFSRLPLPEAAAGLIQVLEQEHADALTIHEPAGRTEHPDHRQVNRAGLYAALETGTPCVLEASRSRPEAPAHRVDVRAFLRAKRRALLTYSSRQSPSTDPHTVLRLLQLPAPAFRLAAGREWFVERTPHSPVTDDLLGPQTSLIGSPTHLRASAHPTA